ncbi:MAG: hypothetical protein AAF628_12460 [Planctomycetota bacterium]
MHTAPADPAGGEDGVWADARDDKVQFGDGFRLFPRGGPGSSRTVSLGWRTESIRGGDRNLTVRPPPANQAQ